jgi:hypothetical protein
MRKVVGRWLVGLVAVATVARLVCACSDGGSDTTNGSSGSSGSSGSNGSSGSSGASTGDAGSGTALTGSASDGLAACYAYCDHQTEPGCKKTPANYGASCKLICDATYKRVPADCTGARVAVDVCSRDKVTFTCVNDLPQLSPVGACAREGQTCAKCSPEAGLDCFSNLF